jgi:hypothetical protein
MFFVHLSCRAPLAESAAVNLSKVFSKRAIAALDQVRRAMGPAPRSMLATGTLVFMWVRQLEAA